MNMNEGMSLAKVRMEHEQSRAEKDGETDDEEAEATRFVC